MNDQDSVQYIREQLAGIVAAVEKLLHITPLVLDHSVDVATTTHTLDHLEEALSSISLEATAPMVAFLLREHIVLLTTHLKVMGGTLEMTDQNREKLTRLTNIQLQKLGGIRRASEFILEGDVADSTRLRKQIREKYETMLRLMKRDPLGAMSYFAGPRIFDDAYLGTLRDYAQALMESSNASS